MAVIEEGAPAPAQQGTVVQATRHHAPLRRRRDRRRRAARRLARRRGGPARRRHGPVGLRQVDAHAHPRGPRQADDRHGRDRRHGDHRRSNDGKLTRLRRQHIGFVFQFFNLLPMLTAEENVVLPLSIAGEKPGQAVARRPARRRRASPTGARTARPSSRAASSSASRSRARSSRGRRSSSPTSRPATSTRRPAARSSSSCARRSTHYGQTTVMVTHEARAAVIADRILFIADGLIVQELQGRDRSRRCSTSSAGLDS